MTAAERGACIAVKANVNSPVSERLARLKEVRAYYQRHTFPLNRVKLRGHDKPITMEEWLRRMETELYTGVEDPGIHCQERYGRERAAHSA